MAGEYEDIQGMSKEKQRGEAENSILAALSRAWRSALLLCF